MSLIPDTATFHQYLTISNGQLGFTPEARTSPYADYFYPPGWNIVPNWGVPRYNPLTIATWLMGTMPGMEGVSRSEYMLVDDTVDAKDTVQSGGTVDLANNGSLGVVSINTASRIKDVEDTKLIEDIVVAKVTVQSERAVSLPRSGSFQETAVSTVDTAATGETESRSENVDDTESWKAIPSVIAVSPPKYKRFEGTRAVLPTKDVAAIEGDVPINSTKLVKENIAMEDTMPSEFTVFSPSNGPFQVTEPTEDTISRKDNVTIDLEAIDDIELVKDTVFDDELPMMTKNSTVMNTVHIKEGLMTDKTPEDTEFDAAVPTMPVKDAVMGTVSKLEHVPMEVTVDDAEDLKDTVSDSSNGLFKDTEPNTVTVFSPDALVGTIPNQEDATSLASRKRKMCSNCSENIAFCKSLCKACYHYQLRNKRPRPFLDISFKKSNKNNVCSNCLTTENKLWSTSRLMTGILCGACYYFEGRHKTPRPFETLVPIAKLNKICSNCSTTETCQWYHNPSKTGLFCKNCYSLEQKNKTTRPAALYDTIKMKDMEKKCAVFENGLLTVD